MVLVLLLPVITVLTRLGGCHSAVACKASAMEASSQTTLDDIRHDDVKLWVKPTRTFDRLVIQLRLDNVVTMSPPFVVEEENVTLYKKDLVGEEDGFNWTSIRISVFKDKRLLAGDLLSIRAKVNGRSHITRTSYWWRKYRFEAIVVTLYGSAMWLLNCDPYLSTDHGPVPLPSRLSGSNLPAVVVVVVIVTLLVCFCLAGVIYLRKRSRKMDIVKEEGVYIDLDEVLKNNRDHSGTEGAYGYEISLNNYGPPPLPPLPKVFVQKDEDETTHCCHEQPLTVAKAVSNEYIILSSGEKTSIPHKGSVTDGTYVNFDKDNSKSGAESEGAAQILCAKDVHGYEVPVSARGCPSVPHVTQEEESQKCLPFSHTEKECHHEPVANSRAGNSHYVDMSLKLNNTLAI